MAAPKKIHGVVAYCVPRQDGGFLVVTNNKLSGVSSVEIPVGRSITIIDGRVGARANA
jgi:hypothetical protein